MSITLESFRVKNFRSILDSGEIKFCRLLCLIGTNESGKTNLLQALYKLNPAYSEQIAPLRDYPRKEYSKIMTSPGNMSFIQAHFRLEEPLLSHIAEMTGYPPELLHMLTVSKYYDGKFLFSFPKSVINACPVDMIHKIFMHFQNNYKEYYHNIRDKDSTHKDLSYFIERLLELTSGSVLLYEKDLNSLVEQIEEFLNNRYAKKQALKLLINEKLKIPIVNIVLLIKEQGIRINDECKKFITSHLPKFVYYSDYKLPEAEIYLPDYFKENTKACSENNIIKLLVDFLQLKDLISGLLIEDINRSKIVNRDVYGRVESTEFESLTADIIRQEHERKKTLNLILQDASVKLTNAFNHWWKQGWYKFRIQIDGNYLSVWVWDDERKDEIELTNRSNGLKWFFYFFLSFLSEQTRNHNNSILLLDEPGLTLHPVAQKYLLSFIGSLSEHNQLVYTTHSPFLISNDNINSLKVLYINNSGNTTIADFDKQSYETINDGYFPVKANLRLILSENLSKFAKPIIVLEKSDKLYLQAIKHMMLKAGVYPEVGEVQFIAATNLRSIPALAKLLYLESGNIPCVLLANDDKNIELKNTKPFFLTETLNATVIIARDKDDVILYVEDMLPAREIARQFARMYRGSLTDDFDDIYNNEKSIVQQMIAFAEINQIKLPDNWRLLLAERITASLDKLVLQLNTDNINEWVHFFQKFG